MVKYEVFVVNDFLKTETISTVREEDYLKVVKEKENLDTIIRQLNLNNLNYKEKIKEKDQEIEKLKQLLKFDGPTSMDISLAYHKKVIKEKEEEIQRLKKVIESKDKTNNNLREEKQVLQDKLDEWEYVEERWTLKYVFENSETKEIKEYEQNGMIKEDAEELIGMDSDNWNHYSLTKEERPDKDKIIEGLIIRAESSEKVIKELEEIIENLEIENTQLRNDHRLKIGLSDRRA